MGDADRKRSALLPALLLLAAVLIPLVWWFRFDCPACEGRGWIAYRNADEKKILEFCPRCDGAGKSSLYRRWFYRLPPEYGR